MRPARARCLRVLAITLAISAPVGAAAPTAGGETPSVVRPTRDLVKLLTTHVVRAEPRVRAARVSVIRASRPITGGQTVLPVVDRTTSGSGRRWVRVMIPGRPNGRRGWIKEAGTEPASTIWHLVVRTRARQVRAYRDGRLRRTFRAIVGKPSTPTPHGEFFVEESIRMPRGAVGGPYVLATSARSNVLQEFAGGPGQIGIHGRTNLGGKPGSAVSHGCVRLVDRSIRWLAAHIRPGVRVTITR